MKITLGSDHRGVEVADELAAHLRSAGHDINVLGTCTGESCDYPEPAWLVARAVQDGYADRGILVCGSGVGMGIAANKVDGVRAVVALDELMATMSRRHNDANVLCLAADRSSVETLLGIADAWLRTDFEGGRHQRRLDKITAIERGHDPAATVVGNSN